jgi:hypothetical protein
MLNQEKPNQEEIRRKKVEKEFIDLIQDILDDSYQAEALLRGIQAVADGLISHLEKDLWEPVHITGISTVLEDMIKTMGDKALEVDHFFQDNLKRSPAPIMRASGGRV